jgi:hypothetical protein
MNSQGETRLAPKGISGSNVVPAATRAAQFNLTLIRWSQHYTAHRCKPLPGRVKGRVRVYECQHCGQRIGVASAGTRQQEACFARERMRRHLKLMHFETILHAQNGEAR